MSPLAVLHQRACPPSRATTCGVPRLAAATARHPHQRRMLSAAVRSGARNLLNRGLMAAPFAAAAAAMPSPAAAEGVKARTLEVSGVRGCVCGCRQLLWRRRACCGRAHGCLPHGLGQLRASSRLHAPLPRTTQDMQFDNTFVRELPGDTETSNTLRQVGVVRQRACSSEQRCTADCQCACTAAAAVCVCAQTRRCQRHHSLQHESAVAAQLSVHACATAATRTRTHTQTRPTARKHETRLRTRSTRWCSPRRQMASPTSWHSQQPPQPCWTWSPPSASGPSLRC
jgi:hypothetical protein